MSDALEPTAEEIAQRGRDALIARLRTAFEEAAASHADALKLDRRQLEELVERAAERADGLQWRRALASVATEDLGIGLAEALTHPAVVRAHVLLGAPSYEEGLARLGPLPAADRGGSEDISDRVVGAGQTGGDAVGQEAGGDTAEQAQSDDLDATPADGALEPADVGRGQEPADVGRGQEPADVGRGQEPADVGRGRRSGGRHRTAETIAGGIPETAEHREAETLRLSATHLGGIADLDAPEHGVELWFSDEGLHIIRATKEPLGRLTWAELRSLEVPSVRSWFPARRRAHAYLVIRGEEGDASFEIPGVAPDELRERLAPMLRSARRI